MNERQKRVLFRALYLLPEGRYADASAASAKGMKVFDRGNQQRGIIGPDGIYREFETVEQVSE